jgi:glycosyltransferase involved in cell wall biosynthesis
MYFTKDNICCILIPHYNSPDGLMKAISSVDRNEKVDIVVVDDGSAISFSENDILSAFNARGNIYFIYLEQNKGITAALNSGLSYIIERGYKYVARLDCSDICVPGRFKMQTDFLEQNQDYGIVGSNCIAINPEGVQLYKIKFPMDDFVIRKRMFINAMFIHPAITLRASALRSIGFYNEVPAAEDYDLFFRILSNWKGHNLQEFLMYIQIDNNGISANRRKAQIISRIKLIKKYYKPGLYSTYGFFRNGILLIIPRSLLGFVKRVFFR